VGLFLQRCGQVIGTRRNFEELLQADEMVGVFPEGAKGTGKPFSHRYQLLRFNVGFIELAIEHKTPIVPVAVTGAEEQAPMLFNLKPIARALGFPYFPVTPTFPLLGPLGMVPYPAKYYIDYGEPFSFHEEYSATALEDPHRLRFLAGRVRKRIQGMLHKRVKERSGVYF
jgi:1-acyl-sn-glycerol-3-phosphate acyltransferase